MSGRTPWGRFTTSPPRQPGSPVELNRWNMQGRRSPSPPRPPGSPGWNIHPRRSPSPRSLQGQPWPRRPLSPRELSGSWVSSGSRPRDYGPPTQLREGSPRGELRRSPRGISPGRMRERSPPSGFRMHSPQRRSRDFSPRLLRSSPSREFAPLSPPRHRDISPPRGFRSLGYPPGIRNHGSPEIARSRSPHFRSRSPSERFRASPPGPRERSPRMVFRSPSPVEWHRSRNLSPEFSRGSQPPFPLSRDRSPQREIRKFSPPRSSSSSIRTFRDGSPPDFRGRSPIDNFVQRISKTSIDSRRFTNDFPPEKIIKENDLRSPLQGHCKALNFSKGKIREYINSFSGIVEIVDAAESNQVPPCAFFHASCVWVTSRGGEIYGTPKKFLDILGPNVIPSEKSIRLEKELEIGSVVNVLTFPVEHSMIPRVALAVWPPSGNDPSDLKSPQFLGSMEARQTHFFKEFANRIVETQSSNKLVQATFPIFPWRGCNPDFNASVMLVEEDYGILRLWGTNKLKLSDERFSFHCLFHKDRVWNIEGQRVADLKEYEGVSLREILPIDTDVTVSARSIISSSGTELRKLQLELQAVVVSMIPNRIPPSAPKPTHCEVGTGAYAMESYSWYFFNQDLHNSLNLELVAYLEKTKSKITGIRPDLLQASKNDNFKLKKKLARGHGKVCNALGRKAVIIESYDKTWRCLVLPERSLHSHNSGWLFQEMSLVFVNATLVDPSASVQYIATAAWDIAMDPPSPSLVANVDTPINENNRDFYNSVVSTVPNNSFDTDTDMPSSLECEEGEIVKIINSTYGIIKHKNHLVLFYNDDMFSDSSDKFLKGPTYLDDLALKRAEVVFNACLVSQSIPISYLATRCYLKKEAGVNANEKLRMGVRIQLDEIKSRSICKAVENFFESPPCLEKEDILSDLSLSEEGIIRCIIRDGKYKDHSQIIGGLISGKGGSVSFFLTRDSLIVTEIPKVSKKVRMNVKPIKDPMMLVQGLSLTIFSLGDVKETANDIEKKYKRCLEKWRQLVRIQPLKEAVLMMKSGKSPTGMVDITSCNIEVPSDDFQPFIDITNATLKYMIDETSGVLEAPDQSLCYFELEDLNVKSRVGIEDLAAIMAGTSATLISYQAKLFNDKGSIQYVAHTKGVQILGDLPFSMQHIKLDMECPKSDIPVRLQSKKLKRYRTAEEICKDGKAIPVAEILDKSYLSREDIVGKVGKIKCILNENFGVIYGPFDKDCNQPKKYALFDKFDFFSSGAFSAADENKNLTDIVQLDMEVVYNACLIDKSMAVPYLVTGCWPTSRADLNPPRQRFLRNEISESKIKVYTQVADECEPTFRKVLDAAAFIRQETKEADVNAVYESGDYQHYTKNVQKRNRLARDPRTPDLFEPITRKNWNSKMFGWKRTLADYVAKNPKPIKLDLYDYDSTCTLYESIDGNFAIMLMPNGEKALLHHERVWLNNRPLFRGWDGLQKAIFKVLNINARRWDGPSSIKYQIVFAHAGVRTRNRVTKKFEYSDDMKKWIQEKYADLDKEAEIFVSKVSRGR